MEFWLLQAAQEQLMSHTGLQPVVHTVQVLLQVMLLHMLVLC